VHLVNPMWANAGSENRTLELYRLLAPSAEVKVWSSHDPDPQLASRVPLERIAPWRGRFPRGGTIVFVGVYFKYGSWIHLSGARRRVVVYNSIHPHVLRRKLRRISELGLRRVEVVFASRWLKASVGIEGPVHASPIDLARFAPGAGVGAVRPFTVGRLSRNQPEKHHRGDPAFYGKLVAQGMSVRIMGGDLLRQPGPLDPRVELLPENGQEAPDFLRGLDCLFYRTDDAWQEPHGRVVQEAMACGLPVVCSRRVGASDYVQDGVNGFLFDEEGEALDVLRRLQRDPALRLRVGAQARRTVEEVFSPAATERVRRFYLDGSEADFDAAAELQRTWDLEATVATRLSS
jgi:glycosyltransferase involved in cell wall biosynthesis